MPFSLASLQQAAAIVHQSLPPTPQIRWPLLCEALGCEVWMKHENHLPVGAFKLRGGLVYFHHLAHQGERPAGVISATRGNHGQSVAFSASRYGIQPIIVVPHGNSREKNAAMRSLGAELIEHGEDFQASREYAAERARQYIHAHLERPLGLDELAQVAQRERWSLSRDFRALFGTSPYRYLIQRRLDIARRLMLGGQTLAEAALAAGFTDQSHMTRHFGQSYGLPPARWLRMLGRA